MNACSPAQYEKNVNGLGITMQSNEHGISFTAHHCHGLTIEGKTILATTTLAAWDDWKQEVDFQCVV